MQQYKLYSTQDYINEYSVLLQKLSTLHANSTDFFERKRLEERMKNIANGIFALGYRPSQLS